MRIPFRGVITFLLTWAILWAVPAFRVQNQRGLSPQPRPDLFQASIISEAELIGALQNAPDDPFLQSQHLQGKWPGWKAPEHARFFRDFDALISRHPRDLTLWRTRLRMATRGNMVPLTYTNRFLKQNERFENSPNPLSTREVEQVVSGARRAQKLAPEEGFFAWIEAMALWGLGRENESIAALDRASRCSEFNDGSADEVRQKLAFLERVRGLEWDDKLGVLWSALLPHLAGMRGLAREVAYSGTARFRAGDKAGAWKRWETILRAGRALRITQSRGRGSTMIGMLVGEAIEQVSWDIAARGAGGFKFQSKVRNGSTREESERRAEEGLKAFTFAARRDGHASLAHLAEIDARDIAARRAQLFAGKNAVQREIELLGWNTPGARLSVQLRWLGEGAMTWALLGTLGWIVAFALSRGGRDERVSISTVWTLSAFFGALWLGLAALAVSDGAGADSYNQILALTSDGDSPITRSSWGIDWNGDFPWAVGATFLAAILLQHWGARRQSASLNAPRTRGFDFWKAATGTSWFLALALSFLLWFGGQQSGGAESVEPVLWIGWAALLALGVFVAWANKKESERNPFPFALNAAAALAFWVLTSWAPRSDLLAWLCLIVGLWTLILGIWNGRGSLWTRAALRANLETGGRVVAGVALVLSLSYLAISLALWPARAGLNARVDRYITLGEMDWLGAQSK